MQQPNKLIASAKHCSESITLWFRIILTAVMHNGTMKIQKKHAYQSTCFLLFFLFRYLVLAKTEFNFIMANYFVQTTRGQYYPAELALIKFNFTDGLIQKYHQYMNPRKFRHISLHFSSEMR